jgi:carotenoid cleavage dioxygenase-like enzyme
MASSVAAPLERQFTEIAGLNSFNSTSSTGASNISLQFDFSRSVASAAKDVQAAISAAAGLGHWFDGDGAILAVNFTNVEAVGVYRYVQTTGYQKETAAGKLLYGNYGMTAPGIIWNQWIKPVKNAANTSVLALPDKLLALWEGGKPYALDLQTLETCGEDDLGSLTKELSYSAHYKHDKNTGEIFNFGVSPGLNATLNVYNSDSTGKIIQTAIHELEGVPLIHDFVLAGQYLVFFISPVRLNLWPVLLGIRSYSDSLKWHPELGTQIIVIDRENLSNGHTHSSEVWVFASDRLNAEPVCKLGLPSVIPHSFHGTWKPA